jgi:hypothetical protein
MIINFFSFVLQQRIFSLEEDLSQLCLYNKSHSRFSRKQKLINSVLPHMFRPNGPLLGGQEKKVKCTGSSFLTLRVLYTKVQLLYFTLLRARMKKSNNKTGKIRTTYHWSAFMQPLLQSKNNKCYLCWVCVCILKYPICNANVHHLRLVWLYNISLPYPINGTIFEKPYRTCLFWFCLQILSEISVILRRNERNMIINLYWSSCQISFILVVF